MQIKVGDEVVLMNVYVDGQLAPGGYPIHHNSRNNSAHPCRGKVLKVGTKWVYVETIGAPWRAAPYQPNQTGCFAIPVEEAKRLYRLNFDSHDQGHRTPEFINQCVEEL